MYVDHLLVPQSLVAEKRQVFTTHGLFLQKSVIFSKRKLTVEFFKKI